MKQCITNDFELFSWSPTSWKLLVPKLSPVTNTQRCGKISLCAAIIGTGRLDDSIDSQGVSFVYVITVMEKLVYTFAHVMQISSRYYWFKNGHISINYGLNGGLCSHFLATYPTGVVSGTVQLVGDPAARAVPSRAGAWCGRASSFDDRHPWIAISGSDSLWWRGGSHVCR